jgi:hypothetical protein
VYFFIVPTSGLFITSGLSARTRQLKSGDMQKARKL